MDRFGLFVSEDSVYSVISAASRVCIREVSDKMEKLMNHSDMSQGIFVLINIDQRFCQAKEGRRGIFWIRERAGENGKRGGCQAKTAVQVRKFEITL